MAADHRISRAQVHGADGFSRLQAIHEAAVECLIQNRLDELSDGMRALTVLFVFAAAIDNGGFAANMYNSTGDHTGEAIKAAETIGADEHAAVFRRFAEVGLAGDLAMTRAARERRLEDMGDEGEEE